MSKRITLPKDHWAELREVEEVTERQRRPLLAAMDAARSENISPDLIERAKAKDQEALQLIAALHGSFVEMADVVDAGLLAMLEAWSFESGISADALLDLPAITLDRLRAVVAPLIDELAPNWDPTLEPSVSADGEPSPLGSGSSNGSKRGTPAAIR